MDNLTTIKGIGKATARQLADAGIASFEALAAATPEQLVAIDKLSGSPAAFASWVSAAKALAPKPVDLNSASPDQVKDQVAKIDAARARVSAAQEAVDKAVGQINVDQAALASELEAAQQALDLLIGPGADRSHASSETNPTHTTPSERKDGEAGNSTGLPTGPSNGAAPGETQAGTDREEFLAYIQDSTIADNALMSLRGRVQRLVTDEGPGGAREFISSERTLIAATIKRLQRFDSELQRLGQECERTESIWPVDAIRYDGAEQPIGVELRVDPKTAAALLASGAALDHDPAKGIEDA